MPIDTSNTGNPTEYQTAGDQAKLAMQQAQQAFKHLLNTSIEQRIAAIANAQSRIVEMREEIVDALVEACGKTRTDANIEIIGVLDWLRWLQRYSKKFLADESVPTSIMLLGKKSRILHEPLGPVLIIAPWNYPFHTGITQVFAAVLCGNSVLYKPSDITPLTGLYEKVFACDPIFSNSVMMCYGNADLGRALIDTQPEKIFFTGSTRAGKEISKQAAQYLIPMDLELGGNDPMIVFPSASIKRAAAAAVWGAFTHNGQSCSAVERLYVHRSIYDPMLTEIVRITKSLKQTTPAQHKDTQGDYDLGHMTIGFQLEKVRAHIEDAVSKGAKIECGGKLVDADALLHQPTVLSHVNNDMEMIQDETFGPVLPIIPFDTEHEVIEWANDDDYGLQGSVFTNDLEQATRVARQLEVGGVSINNVNMVEGNPWLSFGGRKQTGYGRARGVQGLHEFTRSKYLLIEPNSDKIEANWYPYTKRKHNQFVRFINSFFAGKTIAFVKGLIMGLWLEHISQKPRK